MISDYTPPTTRPIRWRRYGFIGMGIMIAKFLLLSILAVMVYPDLRTARVVGRIFTICIFFALPGGIGGAAYAGLERVITNYYARWVASAEVSLLILLLEANFFLSVVWAPPSEEDRTVVYLVSNPLGWLLLAAVAAIAGLVYAKALSDV